MKRPLRPSHWSGGSRGRHAGPGETPLGLSLPTAHVQLLPSESPADTHVPARTPGSRPGTARSRPPPLTCSPAARRKRRRPQRRGAGTSGDALGRGRTVRSAAREAAARAALGDALGRGGDCVPRLLPAWAPLAAVSGGPRPPRPAPGAATPCEPCLPRLQPGPGEARRWPRRPRGERTSRRGACGGGAVAAPRGQRAVRGRPGGPAPRRGAGSARGGAASRSRPSSRLRRPPLAPGVPRQRLAVGASH